MTYMFSVKERSGVGQKRSDSYTYYVVGVAITAVLYIYVGYIYMLAKLPSS